MKNFQKGLYLFVLFCCSVFVFSEEQLVQASITLEGAEEKIDVHDHLFIIKDREDILTIDDIRTKQVDEEFVPIAQINQQKGFFYTANWLKFDVTNHTEQKEWILDFSFPLIYELQIYEEFAGEVKEVYHTGAIFPFQHRPIQHHNFIFNLDIEPNVKKTYYIRAVGGGDLHPPINIWDPTSFQIMNQQESLLLGFFYGIILVMVIYNFFLYISLKIRSYLYYVGVITFTLLGKLSINGIGYQYLWSDYPVFNIASTPIWVSAACIMMLIFMRSFLDLDDYLPKARFGIYGLIGLHCFVLIMLFISHFTALTWMVISAFLTFAFVLITATLALKRGARQARFFIAGWLIFLTGVFITILERSVVLPYSNITEYAGQIALTLEVILLSFALADKINIIRKEKAEAEQQALENHQLAMENLKQADRLKDEFLAITSHELRTPLYGMVGLAESIRDGAFGKVSNKMSNQLSMIVTSGQRLTQLVTDILDLSVLNHQKIELSQKKVHVQGLIDHVCLMSSILIKDKPVQFIKEMVDEELTILGDPNRLQQILYNVLDNAFKYTENGRVTVSARRINNYVAISIKDTGMGIPPEQLEQIFNPFHQVNMEPSRSAIGLGIGLSLTKQLVELHQGTIQVESILGKGSTFRILLPASSAEGEREKQATSDFWDKEQAVDITQPATLKDGVKGTVLIVDDDPINIQVMINQLTLENYRVIYTTDGREVLSIVERESVDLVILDIMMPEISGYQVCQQVRSVYSLIELPIIMLTAKNQAQHKISSFQAGANDYLMKPFDKPELLARVKTLIRAKRLNQELTSLNTQLEEKVIERTNELKTTNEELTNMNQKLVDMAESKREMLQNIAHELGTPVTLMHSYIQSIQEGVIALDDSQYHELVVDKVNILRRLIQDLYDLALLESQKIELSFRCVSLKMWLDRSSLQAAFTIQQRERRAVIEDIPVDLPDYTIMVDEDRINQVYLNLISNAVKHTDPGVGEIKIRYAVDQSLQQLSIQISDNGTGIEADTLPHIFERFYKGKLHNHSSKEQSIGLGLVIVKEIIRAHQGEIYVTSEINKGTHVTIYLPLQIDDEGGGHNGSVQNISN